MADYEKIEGPIVLAGSQLACQADGKRCCYYAANGGWCSEKYRDIQGLGHESPYWCPRAFAALFPSGTNEPENR